MSGRSLIVNVDSEIAYWRERSAELAGHSFGDYVPIIKASCDALLAYPDLDGEIRLSLFKPRFETMQPLPRVPWERAAWLARNVWTHIEAGQERPRQG